MSLREKKVYDYPLFVVTFMGSVLTALWRVALMPIDTVKTVSQVDGKLGDLKYAMQRGRISVLYTGAFAMAVATIFGHYPWFLTFNVLDALLAKPPPGPARAARSAAIGFCSSLVSDVVANPIRVIKTSKQATAAVNAARPPGAPKRTDDTYAALLNAIILQDGVTALFLRGLGTRIVANGLQSIIFTVVWRFLLGD